MKKFIVVAVLVTVVGIGESFAQTQSVGQQANVNMTVQTAMVLTNVGGRVLNFGTRAQGATNITVDPITGGANTAPFALTLAPAGQVVNVSWTHVDMTNGGTTVTWAPSVSVNNVNVQGTSAVISSGGTVTADGSGNAWMWVGGTIASIPGSAPAGAYNGSVTLTVSY